MKVISLGKIGTFISRAALTALVGLILVGAAPQRASAWGVVWSDEFNGSGKPSSTWSYQLGVNGANNEIETYVNSLANCQQVNGYLCIEAQTDTNHNWYSARISGHNWGPYGYLEFRTWFPHSGNGYWPAGWCLGTNIGSVGWPACGEIDIAEEIDGQDINHQSLHMPGWDPTVVWNVGSGWNEYGAYWQPGYITFNMNGTNSATYTSAGHTWEFDGKQQFVLINLAIGGNGSWPGPPNSGTTPNGNFLVDYVRQYE